MSLIAGLKIRIVTTNINIIEYFQDKKRASESYGKVSPKQFNVVIILK